MLTIILTRYEYEGKELISVKMFFFYKCVNTRVLEKFSSNATVTGCQNIGYGALLGFDTFEQYNYSAYTVFYK